MKLQKRKIIPLVLIGFFFAVLAINFISATTFFESISNVGSSLWEEFLEPLTKAIFGAEGDSGTLAISSILIFVILFGLVWLSLVKSKIKIFRRAPPVTVIISLAVSALAVRGIGSSELLQTVLLPYSALGVALSAALPLVIYFIFVNLSLKGIPSFFRRVLWIFFGVIFIALSSMRWPDLKELGWIYVVTAIIALIMAIVDGTITRMMAKFQADTISNLNKKQNVAILRKKIIEIQKMVDDNIMSQDDADELIEHYRERIKYHGRKLK